MDTYEWLTIFSICLIGAITPGPSLIIILYITNTKDLISGIIASVGHGCGIFIYALVSIFSLSFLLHVAPIIVDIIQFIGALFLIYIGSKILSFKPLKQKISHQHKSPTSLTGSYIIGLTTSLINPKVIIFFSAIFSQFLNDDYNFYTKLAMASLASAIDAAWYILASFSITFSIIQKFILLKQKSIFIVFGSILVLLSLILIYNTTINFYLEFFVN
jgi:threonine/homoserine/homoserine lactone efflux protein